MSQGVDQAPNVGQGLTVEDVAKICHSANKILCQANGDWSQPVWANAPDWQRASAIDGVKFLLDNPDAGPGDSHRNWLVMKEKEGWVYGPVKDPAKKEHPCIMHFDDLPPFQQAKDHLFCGIVRSLQDFVVRD